MKRYLLLSLLCVAASAFGQWSDDFDDGDITANPVWVGDTQDFTVNANNLLQLSAAEPGLSRLFSQVNFPDSVRWSGYVLLDFAPSANNNGAIYLALDNTNLAIANGYLLRLGENGSDDAINFNLLSAGVETTLAVGTAGAVSADPAQFRYQVTLNGDGVWTGKFAYANGGVTTEFTLLNTTYPMSLMQYFGIETLYTSSNISKVYFDDFVIEEDLPDTTPPLIVSASVITFGQVEVYFNEAMDALTTTDPSNYLVQPDNIEPSDIVFDLDNPTKVTLLFDPPLMGSTAYSLAISGVADISGNVLASSEYAFLIPEAPSNGDLLLSELLFDPYQDRSDFVEIYNASDKILRLDGVLIENADKLESDVLNTDYLLLPGQYLAICPDTIGLKTEYSPPAEAHFLQNDIPSFNNSDGNVSLGLLVQGVYTRIDSFDYVESMHQVLLDDTEGVSLERLSFSVPASTSSNWFSSSASNNFATPGYANSSSIDFTGEAPDFVYLENKTFSPNGDSYQDFLTLLFDLDKPGYLATVQIFDGRGQLKKTLANNQLLGTQDFILWDGLVDSGRRGNVGIYILNCKVFHPDGDIKSKKLVTVLADYLD